MSLPSRERGLKYLQSYHTVDPARSLPSRERGLKSVQAILKTTVEGVAPLAGAWIEIVNDAERNVKGIAVAPLAGAWIEIMQ